MLKWLKNQKRFQYGQLKWKISNYALVVKKICMYSNLTLLMTAPRLKLKKKIRSNQKYLF